jgi:hypothetical protein
MLSVKKKLSPVAKAAGTVGAVVALAGGVTYAALSSTATLTDTSINTANAGLLLWDGNSFESTASGFTLTGQVPDTPSAPQAFYFKNSGDSAETVSVKANHPPTTDLDLYSNIKVAFDCFGGSSSPVETNVQALIDGYVPLGLTLPVGAQGNSGDPNTVGNCTAKFTIEGSGVNNDSASVSDLDLDFTGTAVAVTPPETD